MNITAFFLAQRILFTHVYQKSISTMTVICFAGIFIGSFALALITAIMNGFEVTIHEKMQNIHSNIIIQSYKNGIDMDALAPVLEKEFPEITAFSPMATHHTLIKTENNNDTPIVAMIKGIDPKTEEYTSSLSKKITNSSSTEFSQLFNKNQIIIGKQLAHNNEVNIGDTVELLFIRDGKVQGKRVT